MVKFSSALNAAKALAAESGKAFAVLMVNGAYKVADSFDLMSKFAAVKDEDVLAVVKADGEVVYA